MTAATPSPKRSRPISDAHQRLGDPLRRIREQTQVSTRKVPQASGRYYSGGHISQVENGAVPPSPELVDAYANMAAQGTDRAELRWLYRQMVDASKQAGLRRRGTAAKPASAGPPQQLAQISDRRDVQQHYVVVDYDAHYAFDLGGVIREVTCAVTLRAKSPRVRYYYSGFTYPTDIRPGVLTIEALSGCVVADTQESTSGAVAAYLQLDRDLSPEDLQPWRLRFRVRVASDARSAPHLRYFADEGNEQLTLRADFSAESAPLLLRWFSARDLIDAEHPVPGHDLTRQDFGGYIHRFEHLVPGWCYGFAWVW